MMITTFKITGNSTVLTVIKRTNYYEGTLIRIYTDWHLWVATNGALMLVSYTTLVYSLFNAMNFIPIRYTMGQPIILAFTLSGTFLYSTIQCILKHKQRMNGTMLKCDTVTLHFSDTIWWSLHLKSPATPLFFKSLSERIITRGHWYESTLIDINIYHHKNNIHMGKL